MYFQNWNKFIFKSQMLTQVRKTSQLYESHIPTCPIQKTILALGSSFMALMNPFRDDMIAVLSETLNPNILQSIKKKMEESEEGSMILKEKPRINSITANLDVLRKLPANSLGVQYVKFMEENKITSESRKPVKFVDNAELAYVLQRYREVHDMAHVLLSQDISILGEIVVKWYEAVQTNLPMCYLAGIFGPFNFTAQEKKKYLDTYLHWAVDAGMKSKFYINIYYEKRWNQDLDDLRKELNIPPLPC